MACNNIITTSCVYRFEGFISVFRLINERKEETGLDTCPSI